MNLFYLRYFVQLAHTKHYTKAARQLCITQPSLSHAIMELEKELGVLLFEKSGRNTVLTPFGEEFLVCAERTLSTLDEGIASLQRSSRGEGIIRLGFLRPLGVDYIPDLAARFLKSCPEQNIQFTFDSGVTGQLLEGLADRRYDLVFCSRPPKQLGFAAVPVRSQELVVIVSKGHALAGRQSVDLRETADWPQIYFSEGSGLRDTVNQMYEQVGVRPVIAYETEEDQVIAGLVARGFGIAVVPWMDLLLKLDVEILKISAPAYERTIYMVSDERMYMAPAVQHFRRFAAEDEKRLCSL